jgi:hypothetical protein
VAANRVGWRHYWRSKIDACLQSDDQRLEIEARLLKDTYFRRYFYVNRSEWFVDQIQRIRAHGACNLYFHSEVPVREPGKPPAGRTRVGKSNACLALISHFEPDFNVKHQVAFSAAQFQQRLRCLKPSEYGRWLMFDEVNPRTGPGSGREQMEIPAWLEQGAQSKTSVGICSPTVKIRYGIAFYTEFFGVNFREGYSMGWLTNASGYGLGWLVFSLPPAPLAAAYEAMKGPHVRRFQASAGAADIALEAQVKQILADPRFRQCESMRDVATLATKKWPTASAWEVNNISRDAWKFEGGRELAAKGAPQPGSEIPVLHESEGLRFRRLERTVDPHFIPRLPALYAAHRRDLPPPKKFRPEMLDAFCRYYGTSESPVSIAADFGLQRSILTNTYEQSGWIAIAMQEVVGYLAEYYVQETLYPSYDRRGGPGQVDLYDPATRQMVEVKTFTRRRTPETEMLSRQALQDPASVTLVIFVPERRRGLLRTTRDSYAVESASSTGSPGAAHAQQKSDIYA